MSGSKKKPKDDKKIITNEDQERMCANYLRKNGYGVFKLDNFSSAEEGESIRKLKLAGYKIEHIKDALVKVDIKQLNNADDIVLYFYERLRRLDPKRVTKDKITSAKSRLVDCSVINTFIKWRVEVGETSVSSAVEELFLIMDVLFERFKDGNIDLFSLGIISVTQNKNFVLAVLREAHLLQDRYLAYEVETLVQMNNCIGYSQMLQETKQQMDKVANQPVLPHNRRTINLGELNGKKSQNRDNRD